MRASIAYLVSTQTKTRGGGATWLEREYTGTGLFFTIRSEEERHQVQNFSYSAAGYVVRCPQEGCVLAAVCV